MSKLLYGDRLDTFIEEEIPKLIKEDLKSHQLFTEMDMHAVVFFHLRRALGERVDWFVRCNLEMAGVKPDICAFNRYAPKFVIEAKFVILPAQAYFPKSKLEEDRLKLRNIRKKYPQLGKGYLIAVFDADRAYDYSLKRDEEWEKHFYREIFINVQDFRNYENWKRNWCTIKSNQM